MALYLGDGERAGFPPAMFCLLQVPSTTRGQTAGSKWLSFFIWVFLWTLRGSRFKVFVFFFVIWVYYSLLQMAPTSKSKLLICHFHCLCHCYSFFVFKICICPHLLLLLHTFKSRRFFSPCLSNIGQQSLSHLGIVLILRKNLKRDSRCLSASTSRSTVPHATQS